ncbi:hypothetical protein AB0K60_02915 [Thermopolyspora sp. NPDC052614]
MARFDGPVLPMAVAPYRLERSRPRLVAHARRPPSPAPPWNVGHLA